MNIECPVCGSKNLKKINSKEVLKGDLGKQVVIDVVMYKCPDCDSEGDFFDENSQTINNALDTLRRDYVATSLDFFSDHKLTFSSIERVLNLPQRTLTKWKNNVSQPTAAGVALLKFLQLYPWLLEAAEHNFDYEISQKIFLKTAFNAMLNNISFYQNKFVEVGAFTTTKSSSYYIHIEKSNDAVLDSHSKSFFSQELKYESKLLSNL
jgi:YgiT-type zinc finger domain-containing protein